MLLKCKLFHWLSGYITLDIEISVLSGHFASKNGKFLKVVKIRTKEIVLDALKKCEGSTNPVKKCHRQSNYPDKNS